MLINLLLLLLGFGLLIKGADWLVAGSSALARKYKISELAIGLTIVAFGTSAPELVVSVIGALDGYNQVVMGNIVGSNVFNLFIILGLAGLLEPLWVQHSTVWKEIPYSLLGALLLWVLANDMLLWGSTAEISRLDGILLFVLFLFFLYYVYHSLRKEPATALAPGNTTRQEPETDSTVEGSTRKHVLFILAGLAGLVIGGRLVIDQAVSLARLLEIDERIIGLTIVAAGTSLPELATSIVAAIRKKADIAVGNIIGSNIFNIFFILAVSAIITPVGYNVAFNNELYLLAAGTVFVFIAMFTGGRHRLDRWEAFFMLAVYLFYAYFFYTSGTVIPVAQ